MKVRMSDDAKAFVRKEGRYLRDRNKAAAEEFRDRMRKARKNITDFNQIGKGDLPVKDLRTLVVGDYRLDYDINDDAIEIVSVRHHKQAMPTLTVDSDFDYEGDPIQNGTPAAMHVEKADRFLVEIADFFERKTKTNQSGTDGAQGS